MTRRQLQGLYHRGEIEVLSRRGLIVRVRRGVWRLPGAGATWEIGVLAESLALEPPGVASHLTAGALWHLAGVARPKVTHLTVPRGVYPRFRDGVAFRRAHLTSAEIRSRSGITVTSPLRTVVDLADG